MEYGHTSNESVGLQEGLLPALSLLIVTEDTGDGRPLQVVTQEHTDGAIVPISLFEDLGQEEKKKKIDLPVANSELTNDTEGNLPGLATTTVLGVTHELGQTRALQQGNFSVRHLLLAVTASSIGGQDLRDLLGTLNPSGGGSG